MDYSKLIKELRKNDSFPSRACRAIRSLIRFGEPVGDGTS